MKPYFVTIKDWETGQSIIVDMEGPYHPKNKRIGEHIYGLTLMIDDVPYHFEKYIPTAREIKKFEIKNTGKMRFSKGGFIYRLVPFTK